MADAQELAGREENIRALEDTARHLPNRKKENKLE